MKDLFERHHSIQYPDFETFMLRLIERDMEQDKMSCYAAILLLAKDLGRKHGTSLIWLCKLFVNNFSDVAVSILFA